MTRLSRCLAAATAAGAIAVGAAGCGTGSASTTPQAGLEKTTITVGAVPTASAAGLYIAQQRGFFKQEGLTVKVLNTATGGAQTLAEQLAGRLDINFGAWEGFILAQAHGAARLHILADGYAASTHVDEVLTLPGSKISTPQQLVGKTIAVNALNNVATLMVSSVLAQYGIQPTQVHWAVVPFPAMTAALAAHRVDAAYLAEPYVSTAEERLGAQVLFDSAQGATLNFPVGGYVVTQQWFQKYPRTAAAFVRALEKGQALGDTNRTAVEQALTANTTVTKQIAGVMAIGNYPTTVDALRVQRVADVMLRFGLLRQHFSVTPMIH
jgi:NitT/TauT family transport system substrate-binding protein